MKQNIGNLDRMIRLIIATIFFTLWFNDLLANVDVENILLVLSGFLLLTSIVGICPLYSFLRVSTCDECKSDFPSHE